MFIKLESSCWLLFFISVRFSALQTADNNEIFLLSTAQPPSISRHQPPKFLKQQEQICAAHVQNSYLLEILKLQNSQIMNTLEHEIKIRNELQNISINQLQEMKEQVQIEMEEMKQNIKQIVDYVDTLSKNRAMNICDNKQLDEAELHIVSAVENIVQQKLGNHDIKLHETTQELMYEIERVEKQIEVHNKKLIDVEKQIKEVKEINNENRKTRLESQTKMLEEYNKRFQNLEKQITNTQYSLSKLRNLPRDCKEIQNTGNNVSGFYYIQPEFASDAFMVLCDMKTRGGGWIYVLNRFDGSQNFYLNWTNYKLGFGKVNGEFWLGLEHLYELTGHKMNELLIELVDWDNKTVYAHYTSFGIGKEEESYPLKTLKGYSGDAKDFFSYHINMNFSTTDHNKSIGGYCANFFRSGWWYKDCFTCHLTGSYLKGNLSTNAKQMGIHWNGFRHFNYSYSLKQARMMVRPHKHSVVLLPHEIEI